MNQYLQKKISSSNVSLNFVETYGFLSFLYERLSIQIAQEKNFKILRTDSLTTAFAENKFFREFGPHTISNGILLRSDLHKLYNSGYITITPDYHLEVSNALKEDYNNGKIYYAMHGQKLQILPDKKIDRPDSSLLSWHNTTVFRAG